MEERVYIGEVPVYCAYTEIVDVATIVGNPKNPNTHPESQLRVLASIIKAQGWRSPVTISKRSGFVVRGHGRLAAALLLGLGQVPVDFQDYANEAAEWADMIADNKIAEMAAIDNTLMGELLSDLQAADFDMELTGFSDKELSNLFEKINPTVAEDDDFDPAPATEVFAKRGDIWELGKHRLMCGDSTIQADVDVLMNGQRAHMMFTDPPWNVDYGANHNHPSWKARKILNDKMDTQDFNEFLTGAFASFKAVALPGAMLYAVMSAQEWGNIMQVLDEMNYHWSSTIIWAKDNFVMSMKDYHTRYEPIWYGWLADAPRLCQLEDRKQDDVWDIPRPRRSDDHPTMKPVELVVKAIINSSYTNDLIVDLFGGSGTTLVAAEQTGRVCNMMELDPKYVDVIIRRYIAQIDGEEGIYFVRDGVKTKYVSNNL
jgi:DNA modification methylase